MVCECPERQHFPTGRAEPALVTRLDVSREAGTPQTRKGMFLGDDEDTQGPWPDGQELFCFWEAAWQVPLLCSDSLAGGRAENP